MNTICPLCGTEYSGIRRPGDRCNDLSLSDDMLTDPGCVGRVMSDVDYHLIDGQALARRLATRQDLYHQPLLRRRQ